MTNLSIAPYLPFGRVRIAAKELIHGMASVLVSVLPDRRYAPICSGCVERVRSVHSESMRWVRDLKLGEHEVLLEVTQRRLRCPTCEWAVRREGLSPERPVEELMADLDSPPVEVHGHQEGSAHNGYCRCRCFHPLVLSWEFGDFLDARLREGNVYTSTDALAFVKPHLQWAGELARRPWLRIDAGFPDEPFLAGVEAEEKWRDGAWLTSNRVLERRAEPHVAKIVAKGEERKNQTHTIELGGYRAKSGKRKWSRKRRVVLVLEERPDELLPHWFFLVTKASAEEAPGLALLKRYRKRGRTEKDYGEWQNALKLALSSTNRPKGSYLSERPRERTRPVDSFAVNEAILLLSLLTANLMRVGCLLVERATSRPCSRQTFRNRLLKSPGRIALHARCVRLWIQEKRAELWKGVARELDHLAGGRGPSGRRCPALGLVAPLPDGEHSQRTIPPGGERGRCS